MALTHHFRIGNVEDIYRWIEPTEFDQRAVKARKNAGFSIRKVGVKNSYVASYGKDISDILMYAKAYNDSQNPNSNFLAVVLSKIVVAEQWVAIL